MKLMARGPSAFKSKLLFLMALSLGSTGCLRTRSDLKEGEQRQTMQQQVVSLQKVHADSASRFSDLEGDFRVLSGKVDSLDEKINKRDQGIETLSKGVQSQNGDHAQKIALLQEALSKMEGQVLQLTSELNAIKSEKAAEVNQKGSRKNLFEMAQDNFEQKEWKKAVLNYQKYRDENPRGPLVSDAIYKMGVCFQELGMHDESKAFYDEVISKYPKSNDARRAKARLKNLKK